jgi:hypothetical protein
VIALLIPFALAEPYRPEIVVLPLQGAPGAAASDLREVGDALQRSLSENGFRPTSPADLATALAEPKRAEILGLVAEGRRLLAEGDADLAVPFLEDAAKKSDQRSDLWLRSDEVAEAWFTFGTSLVVAGDEARARVAFARCVALSPDYLTTLGLDARARGVAEQAATSDPPPLTDTEAARVLSKVGADYLLSGVVRGDGSVQLRLRRGASVRHEVVRPGPFRVRPAGDPWYDDVAIELGVAAMVRTAPPKPPVAPPHTPSAGLPSGTTRDPSASPVSSAATRATPPEPARRRGLAAGTVIASTVLVAAAAGTTVALWPRAAPADPSWTLTIRP